MARTNAILLLVFGGLLVFYLTDADRLEGSRTPPTVSLELFPDFESIDADRIVIESSDGLLEMARDGENWSMKTSGDYPIAREKVDACLAKMESIKKGSVASRNPDSHPRLGVDGSFRQIRIYGEGEDPLIHLYLGMRGLGNKRTFLRKEGMDEVLAVLDTDLNTVFSPVPYAWFESLDLLKFESRALTRMTLETPEGRVVLDRGEEGDWALTEPEDGEVDQSRVTSMARTASEFRFFDVATPSPEIEAGFEEPVLRMTFALGEDEPLELVAGGLNDAGSHRYVRKGGDDRIYLVPQRGFDSMYLGPAEQFLTDPTGASVKRKFTGPAMGGELIQLMMKSTLILDGTPDPSAIDESGAPAGIAANPEARFVEVPFRAERVYKGAENLAGNAVVRVELPARRQLPDLSPESGSHFLMLVAGEADGVYRLAGAPTECLIQPSAATRGTMQQVLGQMAAQAERKKQEAESGGGGN